MLALEDVSSEAIQILMAKAQVSMHLPFSIAGGRIGCALSHHTDTVKDGGLHLAHII